MVEFVFTEDSNSVDSEEQSSEYFYDVSTSNMLNNITSCCFYLIKTFVKIVFFVGFFLR